MNATAVYEAESVTRSIARWGSAAAAIIFGLAFVTDQNLSWSIISGQWLHIALIATMFVGYALAWSKRFEVAGSVLALLGMVGICVLCVATVGFLPDPFFLAVGAPALFHLVAVGLHRYMLPRARA